MATSENQQNTEYAFLEKWNRGRFLSPLLWGLDSGLYEILAYEAVVCLFCAFTSILFQAQTFVLSEIFVNIIYAGAILALRIYLGKKGRMLAWERKKWTSRENFLSRQEMWKLVGICLLVLSLFLHSILIYSAIAKKSRTKGSWKKP